MGCGTDQASAVLGVVQTQKQRLWQLFEVAVCTVVWLIPYLECQAFLPHQKNFLSLGSTGSMGNPCPKQLERQHDFGKIRPNHSEVV